MEIVINVRDRILQQVHFDILDAQQNLLKPLAIHCYTNDPSRLGFLFYDFTFSASLYPALGEEPRFMGYPLKVHVSRRVEGFSLVVEVGMEDAEVYPRVDVKTHPYDCEVGDICLSSGFSHLGKYNYAHIPKNREAVVRLNEYPDMTEYDTWKFGRLGKRSWVRLA